MNIWQYVDYKSNNRDITFDFIRGIALISVVSAHVSGLYNNSSLAIRISCLFNNAGTIGVPVFLVLAGYFSKKTRIIDLSRRMLFIIIPWFFYGSFVYFYLLIRGQVYSYFSWMIGVNSYLYYLPVYITLVFLFNFLSTRIHLVCLITGLSFCYNIIVEFIPNSGASYLNVGIWIVWYGIGVLLKDSKAFNYNRLILCKILFFAFIFTLLLISFYNYRFNAYFEKGFILFGLCSIVAIWYISNCINIENKICKIIRFCGINSLPFYLLHMPIAGIVSRVIYNTNISILDILRIPIVFIITTIIINFIRIVTDGVKHNIFSKAVGIK